MNEQTLQGGCHPEQATIEQVTEALGKRIAELAPTADLTDPHFATIVLSYESLVRKPSITWVKEKTAEELTAVIVESLKQFDNFKNDRFATITGGSPL